MGVFTGIMDDKMETIVVHLHIYIYIQGFRIEGLPPLNPKPRVRIWGLGLRSKVYGLKAACAAANCSQDLGFREWAPL